MFKNVKNHDSHRLLPNDPKLPYHKRKLGKNQAESSSASIHDHDDEVEDISPDPVPETIQHGGSLQDDLPSGVPIAGYASGPTRNSNLQPPAYTLSPTALDRVNQSQASNKLLSSLTVALRAKSRSPTQNAENRTSRFGRDPPRNTLQPANSVQFNEAEEVIAQESLLNNPMIPLVSLDSLQTRAQGAFVELALKNPETIEQALEVKDSLLGFHRACYNEGHWKGSALSFMSRTLMESADWYLYSHELMDLCVDMTAHLPKETPLVIMTAVNTVDMLLDGEELEKAIATMQPHENLLELLETGAPITDELLRAGLKTAEIWLYRRDPAKALELIRKVSIAAMTKPNVFASTLHFTMIVKGFTCLRYGLVDEAEEAFRVIRRGVPAKDGRTHIFHDLSGAGLLLCSAYHPNTDTMTTIRELCDALASMSHKLGSHHPYTELLRILIVGLCRERGEPGLSLVECLHHLARIGGEDNGLDLHIANLLGQIEQPPLIQGRSENAVAGLATATRLKSRILKELHIDMFLESEPCTH